MFLSEWLGGDVWIYGDVPLLQQPFGDVKPIPVLPAPGAQLSREDIRLSRESQVPDLQFEFGSDNWRGGNEPPSAGIAACATYFGDGGWSCHSADDTPCGFSPQLESRVAA
jgi:hypothetical protein